MFLGSNMVYMYKMGQCTLDGHILYSHVIGFVSHILYSSQIFEAQNFQSFLWISLGPQKLCSANFFYVKHSRISPKRKKCFCGKLLITLSAKIMRLKNFASARGTQFLWLYSRLIFLYKCISCSCHKYLPLSAYPL